MVLYHIKYHDPFKINKGKGKGKAIHVQVYYSPRGFQEVETPTFEDSRHMKMVRFSALRTHHLYP